MNRLALAACAIAACVILVSASFAAADEPMSKPDAEPLPPPRPANSVLLPYYLPSSLPRPGTREVWQYYAVDRSGRWRPRVVDSPLGAFYLYNGQPFYHTTTIPEIHMPYAID